MRPGEATRQLDIVVDDFGIQYPSTVTGSARKVPATGRRAGDDARARIAYAATIELTATRNGVTQASSRDGALNFLVGS